MELYESSDESMKPKNSKPVSERETTAKQRPQSEKKPLRDTPHDPENSIISYVQGLVTKKQKAEHKGKYHVALTCKHKLEDLKGHILTQRLQELERGQKQERKEIKKAHEGEMRRVDETWARLEESYERKVQQMVFQWKAKKEKEIQRLERQAQRMSQGHLKLRSRSIQQLKKAKRYFQKNEDYYQAKLISKEIEFLTLQLFQKANTDMRHKLLSLESNLYEKHQKEESVLKERIRKSKEEQLIHMGRQKRKLQMKYQNILKRMQRQHFLESQALQGNPESGSLGLSRRNVGWIIEHSGEI